MKDTAKLAVAALAVFAGVVVITASIAITASVWTECRNDGHSFFYCMRLVGK